MDLDITNVYINILTCKYFIAYWGMKQNVTKQTSVFIHFGFTYIFGYISMFHIYKMEEKFTKKYRPKYFSN